MLDMIAFDADDTLWHNETRYLHAITELARLLSHDHPSETVRRRLDEVESRNVPVWGYGVKSFTLSMIEVAVGLSGGAATGSQVQAILGLGRQMLEGPPQLFEHAEAVVAQLAARFDLMLITKGDVFEQGRKIGQSGLAPYFRHVEIVGEKNADAYRAILSRCGVDAGRFLMIGNALRSDILPVLEIGGQAAYIPYEHTWSHEQAPGSSASKDGYYELAHLGLLPALLERLGR
jgi:putative hydrolase of the HAD superfamily